MSNARNLARLIVDSGGDVDVSSLGNIDLTTRVAKTGDLMTGRLLIKNHEAGRFGLDGLSGIDIVPVPDSTQTSPFIRFYDVPTAADLESTVVDDNNWAIGADDTGVSSFKIVYGGGASSSKITSIQGVEAPFEIGSDLLTKVNLKTSKLFDSEGITSITGGSNISPYSTTPAAGSYLVSASIQSRGGNATGGDQDQCRLSAYVDNNVVANADIFRTDSSWISYEDYGSFTIIVGLNGSQPLRVSLYTTDPGDPGGGDVNYSIRIWKIGG